MRQKTLLSFVVCRVVNFCEASVCDRKKLSEWAKPMPGSHPTRTQISVRKFLPDNIFEEKEL